MINHGKHLNKVSSQKNLQSYGKLIIYFQQLNVTISIASNVTFSRKKSFKIFYNVNLTIFWYIKIKFVILTYCIKLITDLHHYFHFYACLVLIFFELKMMQMCIFLIEGKFIDYVINNSIQRGGNIINTNDI